MADNAPTSNNSSQLIIINGQSQQSPTDKPYSAPLLDFETTTETSSSNEAKNVPTLIGRVKSTITSIASSTEAESVTTPIAGSTTEPPELSPYGVICVPMLFNEKTDNGEQVQNERIICYPAPSPPTPQKDMKSKPVEIAGDIMEH